MVNELPAQRAKLVKKLWAQLESSMVHFDILHYNALLKAHSDNDVNISPEQFLTGIKERRLNPSPCETPIAFVNSLLIITIFLLQTYIRLTRRPICTSGKS